MIELIVERCNKMITDVSKTQWPWSGSWFTLIQWWMPPLLPTLLIINIQTFCLQLHEDTEYCRAESYKYSSTLGVTFHKLLLVAASSTPYGFIQMKESMDKSSFNWNFRHCVCLEHGESPQASGWGYLIWLTAQSCSSSWSCLQHY